MNDLTVEVDIEPWLVDGMLESGQGLSTELWQANFDVERYVVFSKLGPYSKLFLRPENFVPRFYHTLYPLLIEDWLVSETVQIFDGFCTVDTQINIRFQATFSYAQRQQELLSEINAYIKQTYYSCVIDLSSHQLQNLQDDSWVRTGLGDIEKAIIQSVSEMLALEDIQSQVSCKIQATFAEFPDVQLGKENVYLSVLKKNYEVSHENREELFRQQQHKQEQSLAHKQALLDNFAKNAELDRLKQEQDAEHQRQLLLDQEGYQQQQLEVEMRLHENKVQYETRLKEISLQAEIQQKHKQEESLRASEKQLKTASLVHQVSLKQQEIQSDIDNFMHKEDQWAAARSKQKELELEHEHQQEQKKNALIVASKKREEDQRMALQEQNYQKTKNSDIYLRREIELLELDKKRLALQLDIQESKLEAEA